MTVNKKLQLIEDRFKVVCGIGGDMTKYPLMVLDDVQFETDKEKSRTFAEVFTPLHIVDQMLDCVPQMSMKTNNLDLCSGYGQFSIRMLRALYAKHGSALKVLEYLKAHHYFAELQLSSCFKLMWIFSTDINLFIGDALKLGKLPYNAKGIWYYLDALGEWVNVTGLVKALMIKELKVFGDIKGKTFPDSKLFVYPQEKEEKFVKIFSSMIDSINKNCEGYKMSIKQLVRMKEGRQYLINLVKEVSTEAKINWQEHPTPEDIVREMVNTVPEVTSLKRVLVLYNIEFLECLVKEKRIDPSCIDFGYDSVLEGELAKAIYKVGVFSVDHCMESLRASTVEAMEKRGGYDVVFSNPPYQIQSEEQKNREGGGSKQAKPIYHEIVMHTIDALHPRYVCMITPSRWMVGGMGLGSYRARMLADKRIKLIQDFPGSTEIFSTVIIKGGVSYFLWDQNHNGNCDFNGSIRNLGEFDVVVRDTISCQILRKILAKTTKFCNDQVLPNKPFGLPTNFKDWVTESTSGAVKCYARDKKVYYTTIYNDTHNVKSLWKVCTSCGINPNSEGRFEVYNQLFQVGVNEICTETYLVAGAFQTKNEANNYEAYMKTKFYRFMLSLRVISQHINTEKFAWVPDLENYNHVYSDKDLYQHFGLTKKEIEHIEKSIKEIK